MEKENDDIKHGDQTISNVSVRGRGIIQQGQKNSIASPSTRSSSRNDDDTPSSDIKNDDIKHGDQTISNVSVRGRGIIQQGQKNYIASPSTKSSSRNDDDTLSSDITNEHFPKARVPVNTQLQKKNTIDGDDGNSQETHNQAELKQSINTPKDSSKVRCQNFKNWISRCKCWYILIFIACFILLFLYWLISGDTGFVTYLLAAIPVAVLSWVFKTVGIPIDLKLPVNFTATK